MKLGKLLWSWAKADDRQVWSLRSCLISSLHEDLDFDIIEVFDYLGVLNEIELRELE